MEKLERLESRFPKATSGQGRRIGAPGLALLVLAGTLPASCAGTSARPAETAAERPSFILFFTDDQRWDALGRVQPALRTPHLDALADEGVYFPNAFVTSSICPASRVTLLTGLHERSHRYTFFEPPLSARWTAASFPALLRETGYRTGMIGKDGVAFEDGAVPEMFDVFVPLSLQPSYFKPQADGSLRHLTDLTGDHVESFLESQDPRQPFGLWVTFNAPHAQFVNLGGGEIEQFFEWPERFDALYEDTTFPLPPTSEPAFLDTQPLFLRGSENHRRGAVLWNPSEYQENLRGYHRMIAAVDDVVGRVRRKLAELGRADDTVIFFLSDNGYFLGERGGFSGKWLPHEPSIRIPMMIYDPRPGGAGQVSRAARGEIRDEIVLNVDVAPTVLDLAGVEIPEGMQGRSVVPLLQAGPSSPTWRQDFFVEHLMDPSLPQNPFNIPRHEGVRTADGWKYAHYFDEDFEELYRLADDPWEERNLAGDPAFESVLVGLRRRTAELRDLYASVIFSDGFESGDRSAWSIP